MGVASDSAAAQTGSVGNRQAGTGSSRFFGWSSGSSGSGRKGSGFFKKFLPGSRSSQAQLEQQLQTLPEQYRAQLRQEISSNPNARFRLVLADPEDGGDLDSAYDEHAHISRAMEQSLRSVHVPAAAPDSPALRFFNTGRLSYDDRLSDGFYACFGEFPEVAEKGQLPSLADLRLCTVLAEDPREAVLVQLEGRHGLRGFEQAVLGILGQPGLTAAAAVSRAAAEVARRLGGPRCEADLAAAYSGHAASLKVQFGSEVLPLGALEIGLSRHRVLLFKFAVEVLGVRCRIAPAGDTSYALNAFIMHDNVEFHVNLSTQPGHVNPVRGAPPSYAPALSPSSIDRLRVSDSSGRRAASVAGSPRSNRNYPANTPERTSLSLHGHLRHGLRSQTGTPLDTPQPSPPQSPRGAPLHAPGPETLANDEPNPWYNLGYTPPSSPSAPRDWPFHDAGLLSASIQPHDPARSSSAGSRRSRRARSPALMRSSRSENALEPGVPPATRRHTMSQRDSARYFPGNTDSGMLSDVSSHLSGGIALDGQHWGDPTQPYAGRAPHTTTYFAEQSQPSIRLPGVSALQGENSFSFNSAHRSPLTPKVWPPAGPHHPSPRHAASHAQLRSAASFTARSGSTSARGAHRDSSPAAGDDAARPLRRGSRSAAGATTSMPNLAEVLRDSSGRGGAPGATHEQPAPPSRAGRQASASGLRHQVSFSGVANRPSLHAVANLASRLGGSHPGAAHSGGVGAPLRQEQHNEERLSPYYADMPRPLSTPSFDVRRSAAGDPAEPALDPFPRSSAGLAGRFASAFDESPVERRAAAGPDRDVRSTPGIGNLPSAFGDSAQSGPIDHFRTGFSDSGTVVGLFSTMTGSNAQSASMQNSLEPPQTAAARLGVAPLASAFGGRAATPSPRGSPRAHTPNSMAVLGSAFGGGDDDDDDDDIGGLLGPPPSLAALASSLRGDVSPTARSDRSSSDASQRSADLPSSSLRNVVHYASARSSRHRLVTASSEDAGASEPFGAHTPPHHSSSVPSLPSPLVQHSSSTTPAHSLHSSTMLSVNADGSQPPRKLAPSAPAPAPPRKSASSLPHAATSSTSNTVPLPFARSISPDASVDAPYDAAGTHDFSAFDVGTFQTSPLSSPQRDRHSQSPHPGALPRALIPSAFDDTDASGRRYGSGQSPRPSPLGNSDAPLGAWDADAGLSYPSSSVEPPRSADGRYASGVYPPAGPPSGGHSGRSAVAFARGPSHEHSGATEDLRGVDGRLGASHPGSEAALASRTNSTLSGISVLRSGRDGDGDGDESSAPLSGAGAALRHYESRFRMWIRPDDIRMTSEVIGRGSYGQVMLAKFRTERCAVKQILCETESEYRACMHELLLMQELQFDKIVRFFGAVKHDRDCLWMCMEYMPFSDLRKILHSAAHRERVCFPPAGLKLARRLKWAKDVVSALDLLHSRNVVHRDLKPGNILISSRCDAVLADFGLSRVREAQQSRLQASGPGTVSYAAPEAIHNNEVSAASDMYSFGCVLWELLTMQEPWRELGGQAFRIMSKIIHERAHLDVAAVPVAVRDQLPAVVDGLRRCFSFDPAARPTAEAMFEVLDEAIEVVMA